MDGFEIQGVSGDEGNPFFAATVGHLLPVESRFAAEDEVGSKRFNFSEEFIGLTGFVVAVPVFFTGLIDDAGVHLVGRQIDSTVEWMLL